MYLKYAMTGLTTALSVSRLIKEEMNNPVIEIYEPIDTVTIIVPILNEDKFIEKSLLSLKNQTIIQKYPQYFEILVADSGSTDNTIPIIKNLYSKGIVDTIIHTPKGKLTTRNLAIKKAKGNIITSADGDSEYPKHWLNTLLSEFYEPLTVAVSGSTIDNVSLSPILQDFVYVLDNLGRTIIYPNKLTGRNSCFYKHVFYLSGGFNERVDQLDVDAMIKEEEVDFGDRLAKYGRVVYKMNASCFHYGGFRGLCRIGLGNPDICNKEKITIERFGDIKIRG